MRILIYTEEEILNKREKNELEEKYLIKIDLINDIEEAEYCTLIREYELSFIQYYDKNKISMLSYLKYIKDKKVYVFGNSFSETIKTVSAYKKFISKDIEKKSDILNIIEIEELIKKRINEDTNRRILKINKKEQNIYIKVDKKEEKINFKSKTDFLVFLCLARNYEKTVNVTTLLSATQDEPELTHNSLIEGAITSIRGKIKKAFNKDSIKNYKKVGYTLVL